MPEGCLRQAGLICQFSEQAFLHCECLTHPANDSFTVEIGIGNRDEKVHGHQVVDCLIYGLSFFAQLRRYRRKSLGYIDQKVLHGRNLRLLAADT